MRAGAQINLKYNVLPIKNFYSKEVSATLDLQADYINWRTSQTTFSFCNYPFLLTPVRCNGGAERGLRALRAARASSCPGTAVRPMRPARSGRHSVPGGQSPHHALACGAADAE